MSKESDLELQSQVDIGSCDEEEDYSPISEGEEDSEATIETPRLGHNYIRPVVSP